MPPVQPTGSAARLFARLKGGPPFAQLTADQLAALSTLAEQVELDVGELLYEEEREGRDAFVLLDGALVVRRITPLGPVRLASLVSHDLAGEPSFLDGLPREASTAATARVVALRLPFEPAMALVQGDEMFAVALLRVFWRSLASRLRKANATMMRIMGTSAPETLTVVGETVRRHDAGKPEKLDALMATGLSAEGLDLLAATMRSERFGANEVVVTEGSPGDVLYLLAEGRARVSRRVPGIGEEALLILGRGDVFGEVAFVDGSARTADVRAHEGGCTVLSVNRERLEEFLTAHPAAARQLLGLVCRTLCARLRAMGNQLVAWHVMAGFGGPSPDAHL